MCFYASKSTSAACHDFYDLQLVTVLELAFGKFRRRNRFSIVFHHDAARKKPLRDEKSFDGAGQRGGNRLTVGDDVFHE